MLEKSAKRLREAPKQRLDGLDRPISMAGLLDAQLRGICADHP